MYHFCCFLYQCHIDWGAQVHRRHTGMMQCLSKQHTSTFIDHESDMNFMVHFRFQPSNYVSRELNWSGLLFRKYRGTLTGIHVGADDFVFFFLIWHDDVIKWKHFPSSWPFVQVTDEFPAQRPVTRSVDVFFDLRVNRQLSKEWRRWWFETLPRSLWRDCNLDINSISKKHDVCSGPSQMKSQWMQRLVLTETQQWCSSIKLIISYHSYDINRWYAEQR